LPCQSCHRMNGKGGKAGPDLTHEARRHADIEWHIQHLKDPQKMKPGSDMPPFDNLSPQDLKALAAYLATRK
jgi:cbb3-type cytochrome oxidase cytochrome c subunit